MIGIFDSGVGGLTVMRSVRKELPSSDIVYFGDIKNAPYGERTREELSQLTVDALKTLKGEGAERIVSACNSVSASLAVSLFDAFSLVPNQLIEMVGPTVSYFRDVDAKIALCATPATVKSGMYQNAFRMIGREVECIPIAGLAGAIEFGGSKEKVTGIVQSALDGLAAYDVLILACTHYPLVDDIFRDIVGPDVTIFDPAVAVAERAKALFWPQEVGYTKTRFLITKESEQFRTLVAKIFPDIEYTVEVVK